MTLQLIVLRHGVAVSGQDRQKLELVWIKLVLTILQTKLWVLFSQPISIDLIRFESLPRDIDRTRILQLPLCFFLWALLTICIGAARTTGRRLFVVNRLWDAEAMDRVLSKLVVLYYLVSDNGRQNCDVLLHLVIDSFRRVAQKQSCL